MHEMEFIFEYCGIIIQIAFYGSFSEAGFLCIHRQLRQVRYLISTSKQPTDIGLVCPNSSDIGTYIGQGLVVCSFRVLAETPINRALIRTYGYLSASRLSAATLLVGTLFIMAAGLSLDKRLVAIV